MYEPVTFENVWVGLIMEEVEVWFAKERVT